MRNIFRAALCYMVFSELIFAQTTSIYLQSISLPTPNAASTSNVNVLPESTLACVLNTQNACGTNLSTQNSTANAAQTSPNNTSTTINTSLGQTAVITSPNGVSITIPFTPPTTSAATNNVNNLILEIQSEINRWANSSTSRVDSGIPVQAIFSEPRTGTKPNNVCTDVFLVNLIRGDLRPEVKIMQMFLNKDTDTQISNSGEGSLGFETDYFGAKTEDAVKRFQSKYATDILAPLGLLEPTGQWGASTRAKANKISCGN